MVSIHVVVFLLLLVGFLRLRRINFLRQESRKRKFRQMMHQVRKKRQRMVVMALSYDLYTRRVARSVWCKPQSHSWWKAVRSDMFRNQWWKVNLRMSEDTFVFVCNKLRPYIEKKVTCFRLPVTVEVRVAVTIWKLATNIEYRTLSVLFGLGRSTVGMIAIETSRAISEHLLPQYVKIPRNNTLKANVEGFETFWGFPHAAGAIDGSHIPILRPNEDASDYYNRKGYYSIIVQGLVDYRGLFMDVCIGWPGKVHDARVFANSSLYHKGVNSSLFPDWKRDICGVKVPLIILGDPAYPSLPWLMKPYPETEQTTADQKIYNLPPE